MTVLNIMSLGLPEPEFLASVRALRIAGILWPTAKK